MEENKLLDWLRTHAFKLLTGLFCVVALCIFLERTGTTKKREAKKDFITMRHLLEQFESGEPLASESMEQAETILAHHPELHPKYDRLLAFSFFQQENSAKGLLYSNAALERAVKLSPSPYHEFGLTSLLIAKKEYKNALAEALQLEELIKNNSSLETLRAFNLLRVAFLAKELKQTELESKAWENVQLLSCFPQIAPLFEEGSYTLQTFFAS